MERQVKDLKIDAWKMYTGAELGEKAWFLDDEKVAYPFWEKTKTLGVKNLCVHKGLPLGAFNEKACTPLDVEKAAKDWPDLNFIVYHSGFRGFPAGIGQGTGDKVVDPKTERPAGDPLDQRHPPHPQAEPGDQERLLRAGQHVQHDLSAFAPGDLPAHARPDDPGRRRRPHPLGHRLDLGRQPAEPDRPPPPAQDADDLIEKYEYPELTDAVKNQIFGLNAAKLFGVDPKAAAAGDQGRQAVACFARSTGTTRRPSNTQYGWVWVDDGREPTTPIGEA